MCSKLDSDIIFLFNEDHKIICEIDTLTRTIKEFNKFKVDYMPYTFFKANRLTTHNILPLNPKQKISLTFLISIKIN